MAPEASTYEYEALKPASQADGEFRLLTLLPGSKGSHICCRLQRVSFSQQPKYEALSYTWGNPKLADSLKGCLSPLLGDATSTYRITLSGQAATITYNLESALQELRSNSAERVLWVDALCINQLDLPEKIQQVKAMARVYHGASRVLVWLGEHDRFVDLAFDTLEQLCWATKFGILNYCAQERGLPISEISEDVMTSVIESEARTANEHSPLQKTRDIHDKVIRAMSLIPNLSTEVSDVREWAATQWSTNASLATAVIANEFRVGDLPDTRERIASLREVFIQRTYWSRLWVVQELLWAPEVIIICGQRQVNMVMMSLPIFLMSVAIYTSHPLNAFFRSIDHEILVEFDTVLKNPIGFCLSGSSGSLSSLIQNYAENLCFEPRDRIYALLSLSIPSIEIEPDYLKPVAEVYVETTYAVINRDQNLDIFNLLEPIWFSNWMATSMARYVLQAPGYKSFEALASRIDDAEVLRHCVDLAEQVNEQSPPTVDTWQALFMDLYQAPNHVRKSRLSTSEEARQAFVADLHLAQDPSTPPSGKFLRILYACLDAKAICKTTKGNIALVLGDTNPGDLVFIAKGATNPFILRPGKGGEMLEKQKRKYGIPTFYQLVGSAYVYGIMDGEVLSMAEDAKAAQRSLFQKALVRVDGSFVRETSVFLI